MEQRRKYQRFPAELKANFFGAGSAAPKRCTISEISGSGLIIEFLPTDAVKIGSNLMLEIDCPGSQEPLHALIKVKRIKHEKDAIHAGCQLTIIKPEDKKRLLDYAYQHILNKETMSN